MIRKMHTIPQLTLALLIVFVGQIFAGENAGATFSLTSEDRLEVAPGETVKAQIAAAGLVDVRGLEIYLDVSPASAFDLAATTFEVPTSWINSGDIGSGTEPTTIDRLFSADLKTSPEFGRASETVITVERIIVSTLGGESDEFDGDDLRMSIAVRPIPTAVQEGVLPAPMTSLAQNFPNPFNAETQIHIDLNRATSVTLTVYDVTGQAVRTLVSGGLMEAGTHTLVWDGRSTIGDMAGSGVYFYELRAGSRSLVKKMLLLQ